eukprot:6961464-Prymnesium_polylepis.1
MNAARRPAPEGVAGSKAPYMLMEERGSPYDLVVRARRPASQASQATRREKGAPGRGGGALGSARRRPAVVKRWRAQRWRCEAPRPEGRPPLRAAARSLRRSPRHLVA